MRIIQLDIKRFSKIIKYSDGDGISIYMIPSRMDCQYDQSLNNLMIQFEYPDCEPIEYVFDEHYLIQIGKFTKRVFSITLSVHRYDSSIVRRQIPDRISGILRYLTETTVEMKPSYKHIEHVLDMHQESLFKLALDQ